MTWLDTLTEKALARELPARAEALRVLDSADDELMDVVAAAFKVRLRYFGRRVKLNYLARERAAARHWQAPETERLGEWLLRAAAGPALYLRCGFRDSRRYCYMVAP